MQFVVGAMRYYDEEDPKKPRPVHGLRKGNNMLEAEEAEPHTVWKDRGQDHHRHVHRC
jgi:hypothetical protein